MRAPSVATSRWWPHPHRPDRREIREAPIPVELGEAGHQLAEQSIVTRLAIDGSIGDVPTTSVQLFEEPCEFRY
jgi:hypothetical protein